MSFWFSFLSLSLQSHYPQNYSRWRAPCTDSPVTLRPQPRRGQRCAGDGEKGWRAGVAVCAGAERGWCRWHRADCCWRAEPVMLEG